jgi:uncharacterized coiled-coil protein SlyX
MKKSLFASILMALIGGSFASSVIADDRLVRFKGAIGDIPVANVAGTPNPDGSFPDVIRKIVRGVNPAGQIWVISDFRADVKVDGRIRVDGRGLLGTITSSRRFKEEIEPMAQASEGLFALKPVTFRYKKGIDPQRIPQFGLVAEDVEAVNPDLVVRDEEGKVTTVRYDAVNAMLLNEFLKEHRKVEELSSIVAEQRKEINALAAAVKEQAAQVQKVSAQVELSKVEPRMVVNKQ